MVTQQKWKNYLYWNVEKNSLYINKYIQRVAFHTSHYIYSNGKGTQNTLL